MRIEITKEWCLRMAQLEGDTSISAGLFGYSTPLDRKVDILIQAINFFERVQASSTEEKIAVGTDHYDWLISAAKGVRDAYGPRTRSE